ncbi:hypothetical protein YC2023_077876 [Brassica napus]
MYALNKVGEVASLEISLYLKTDLCIKHFRTLYFGSCLRSYHRLQSFCLSLLETVFRSRSYDELASLNAAPVSYVPPSSINVAERIVEVGGDVSRMPRNSYLDELESPRTFGIGKVLVSPVSRHNVKQQNEQIGEDCSGSECKI